MKLTGLSGRSFGRARAQLSKALSGAISDALEGRSSGTRGVPLDDREIAERSKQRLKRVLNDDRELLDERSEGALAGADADDPEPRERRNASELAAVESAEAALESKRRLAHLLKRDRKLLAQQPSTDDMDEALFAAAAELSSATDEAGVSSAGEIRAAAELSSATDEASVSSTGEIRAAAASGTSMPSASSSGEIRAASASSNGQVRPAAPSAIDPALAHTLAELLAAPEAKPAPATKPAKGPAVAGLWANDNSSAKADSTPSPLTAPTAPTPARAAEPSAEPPRAAGAAGTGDDDEPAQDPIRTRSMARLLASQGHHDRALSIYRELIARNANDESLRAEAEALQARA